MSEITPAAVRALLQPDAGLARAYQIIRHPDPPHLYLMAVDIGTRFAGSAEPTLHDLAGAYDLRAEGAALRGLGEAVERHALAPRPGLPVVHASRAELVARGEAVAQTGDWPGHWPVPEDEEHAWYPAELLGSGDRQLVPAAWVDCPAQGPFAEEWEGTPSGAAAHTSLAAATAAAVHELLERDALMRSWYRPDRAGAVELDLEPMAVELHRLVRDQPQVRVRAARLSTVVPGLDGYVAWVDDGTTVGTGATVGADDIVGTGRAVLEAWQIYLALRGRQRSAPTAVAGAFAEQGEARCDFWTDGRGREAMAQWAAGIGSPQAPTLDARSSTTAPEAVASLLRAGLPMLRVDLTARLPQAIREAGFVAVKVLLGGTQPLVLDERAEWSFVADLLPERWPVDYQPLI